MIRASSIRTDQRSTTPACGTRPVIRSTYQTLQGLQPYYTFNDVDIDRYDINGQTTQVLIAARDLNSASLPSQSWVNQHLVYTHGYGAVVSPTNQADTSGNPAFNLSNIPPMSNGISLTNQGAQVYFGENLSGYTIVNGKQSEFNFARADNTNAMYALLRQGRGPPDEHHHPGGVRVALR